MRNDGDITDFIHGNVSPGRKRRETYERRQPSQTSASGKCRNRLGGVKAPQRNARRPEFRVKTRFFERRPRGSVNPSVVLADQILQPARGGFRFGCLEFHRPKRKYSRVKTWDRPSWAIPNNFSRVLVRCRPLCDYCYWQPGSLKLPMRVCQGAVVPGGGSGGGGSGRGSPLTS